LKLQENRPTTDRTGGRRASLLACLENSIGL